MLEYVADPGRPASSGNIARKIGTAPRSPTQAMNAHSWAVKRKGPRQSHTASGRATSISVSAMASAGSASGSSEAGETKRPSMTKSTICASQAVPSTNRLISRRPRSRALPSTMPAR